MPNKCSNYMLFLYSAKNIVLQNVGHHTKWLTRPDFSLPFVSPRELTSCIASLIISVVRIFGINTKKHV